ncbi:sulfite exporter TauE/SafE family protein [bacterium]|nr:sulfite exporter TauE/SafE family protein [bacterium]
MFVGGMILVGLLAGIASGALGIGGAILIIPILVYIGGMDQKMAQGTTLLLMLPPIGFFAAWEYWRHGQADWVAAAWICLGFLIGGFIGAKLIANVPPVVLRRAFGLLLILVGAKMFFRP